MRRTTKKQRVIEALNQIIEEANVTRTHDKVCMLAYNIAQDTGGIGLYDYDGQVFFKDAERGAAEFHATGKVTKPYSVKLTY